MVGDNTTIDYCTGDILVVSSSSCYVHGVFPWLATNYLCHYQWTNIPIRIHASFATKTKICYWLQLIGELRVNRAFIAKCTSVSGG